ncbi:restriction endonuclease, SacI family [Phormidium sp. CCY1219]|uniref:restriction endonuclease, SacI family n=1 Tax=Phormidium sp. CCY1219 TaxID=2886104 RepID=UPI002D1EF54B|nr:restriction endonuclease, SacI family [Phormidium sp. CCY1219]MEB3831037.1 restriction endonuclease, SacI family [Phormidium sp. CCY1219]
MTKQTVDNQRAMEALESAWRSVDDERISPRSSVATNIEEIIAVPRNIAFKYILVTGTLAKYVNSQIHPRALQASSELPGAYDARSLCHSVVVPFEKTKGNLFGLSNEPFLSKPARNREHDRSNPLQNKKLANALHDVLDCINAFSPAEVFRSLVYILRLAKQRSERIIEATIEPEEPNYDRVIRFVQNFLQEAEGGVRLVAVTGTFLSLLNQEFEVKVYQPKVSDRFARTAGDIEILHQQTLISATECKHRPLTLDDIRHGIRKAKEYGVAEYCFIYAEGLERERESDIQSEIAERRGNLDILLINIYRVLPAWTSVLNPNRRLLFGEKIVEILRDIRQFDSAKTAANLWNESS